MKKSFLYMFLGLGLVIGLMLTWQFRTKIPLESNLPSDEVETRENLLKSFQDEQAYLQSKIVALRKQISETQSGIETQTEIVNFELLENLKRAIGLTEVSGEGLEIVLDDSPAVKRQEAIATDSNLVQASDIRDVINLLNAANAEAISINNQRIISSSAISSVGTNILVNNSHLAPPFVISAVGDGEIMLRRLLNVNLLTEIYAKRKKDDVLFEIEEKNRISVAIYNADLKTNFLNLVEK